MSDSIPESRILSLTAQIVSAHVSNNALQADALPGLIQSVFQTLTSAGKDTVQPGRPQPAVPAKKSVFADYIVCLEDGKKLKMLKRHLKTAYNMTPEQYRERWELPASYPMVAPNYAAHRLLARQEDRPRHQAREGPGQVPGEGSQSRARQKAGTTVGVPPAAKGQGPFDPITARGWISGLRLGANFLLAPQAIDTGCPRRQCIRKNPKASTEGHRPSREH